MKGSIVRILVVAFAVAGIIACLTAIVFVAVQHTRTLVDTYGLEVVGAGAVVGVLVFGLVAFVAAFFDR